MMKQEESLQKKAYYWGHIFQRAGHALWYDFDGNVEPPEYLPHQVKTKKLAEIQCSIITKGSIYHIKHMYIQPFTTAVDNQKFNV